MRANPRPPRPPRPRRLRTALMALLALGATPWTGGALADGGQGPGSSLSGVMVVGHDQAIVLVGTISWGGTWQSADQGGSYYTNELVVYAAPLEAYDLTLTVQTYESAHGWLAGQAVNLTIGGVTTINVVFPNDPSWRNATIYFDGTPWQGTIAVPISFLPPGIANVGGLDLLALAIVSEAIVVFSLTTYAARRIQRDRAQWAPNFSLLKWGHVVLVALLGAVIFDYQAVDSLFAGWSPLVYVLAVVPLWLLAMLGHFNYSEKGEVLQRLARPGMKIGYRRTLLRYAVLLSGQTVAIKETWGQWLARCFGHYCVIDEGSPLVPELFKGNVYRGKSPTKTYAREPRTDRFKVVNRPQPDEVGMILWSLSGEPIAFVFPELRFKRTRKVFHPAERSPTGVVLKESYTEEKWDFPWPHYVPDQGSAIKWELAPEHYAAAEAVRAGWARVDDLSRVLSKTKTELSIIKAHLNALVNAEIEAQLVPFFMLMGRTHADLTEEEAKAESGSLSALLQEEKLTEVKPDGRKSTTSPP